MKIRIGVAVMTIALALYIFFVGQRAVIMFRTGEPVGIAFGVALAVLPVIGIWAVARELVFGSQADRLGRRLESEGGLPGEHVQVYESGRVHREDGDSLFPKYRAALDEHPDDWRAWYRMGLVYDAAGDRRRARYSIRRAIRLAR